MKAKNIPSLKTHEIERYFRLALDSDRNRYPKILHKQGDYCNRVFNFILSGSYMHPHLHPSPEKIERMYLVKGAFALIIFNDDGSISEIKVIDGKYIDAIDVPAFTWHTYVMLEEQVIIYETMEGVYDAETWKEMAPWAPLENSSDSENYLHNLKLKVNLTV